MSAAWDLTLALIFEGIHGDWIALFFGVAFASLPIMFVVAVVLSVLDSLAVRKAAREQAKRAAKRRHPSTRPVPMTDAEMDRYTRYHTSNQIGRN